jgi:cytochrome c553
MKKIVLVLALTFGLLMLFSGIALANFAIHGGYLADTDACAGCHRAHTATSGITWTDRDGVGGNSALLLGPGNAVLYQFCYVCHGSAAPGAATDVESGVFDNVPAYPRAGMDTESTVGASLNGGGFNQYNGNMTTSVHYYDGTSWNAWGEGNTGPGKLIAMDCGSCHDPHGSSNYRALKDRVNGVDVGGYSGTFTTAVDPDPLPFVISNEVGFPLKGDLDPNGGLITPYPGYPNVPTNGFRLHRQYPAYEPNYTKARYARGENADTGGINYAKGMSGWCAACHTQYNAYGPYQTSTYDAGDGAGYVTRHRHPINVPLSNFRGDRDLVFTPGAWQAWDPTIPYVDLPLDHDPATEEGVAQTDTLDDWIECLTCHRAHGTDATMAGYANVASSLDPQPDTGSGGVPPTGDSALLRANNRGVCERCHNK